MKNTDAAYISALVDTIGTIKIESPKKGVESSLYVWITRGDFKLMEYLQRSGAYVVSLADGQFRAKWRDHKASNLLHAILPFSKMKREQIQIGLEFYDAKTSEQKDHKFDIPYRLRLKMSKKTEDTREEKT